MGSRRRLSAARVVGRGSHARARSARIYEMRACLDGTVPEESVTVVWASRSARDRATPWRIGKRGTLFARAPDPEVVDIYKDVTHLYRRKRSGKNRDRTEWGTTLWIEGAKTQMLQTPAQVRVSFSLFGVPI